MDILSRLNGLVGKDGLLKTTPAGEFRFTFRAVHPPANLPSSETDENAFQLARTRSEFTVQFVDRTLIDGSNTKRVSGFYISKIY
jgi:hypothetical protein